MPVVHAPPTRVPLRPPPLVSGALVLGFWPSSRHSPLGGGGSPRRNPYVLILSPRLPALSTLWTYRNSAASSGVSEMVTVPLGAATKRSGGVLTRLYMN